MHLAMGIFVNDQSEKEKVTLEITLKILKKHFHAFRNPIKPLGIGSSYYLLQRLRGLYPGNNVTQAAVGIFLKKWVAEPAYLEAVEQSRAQNTDGTVTRYTLYGEPIEKEITELKIALVKKEKQRKKTKSKNKRLVPVITFEDALTRWGAAVNGDEKLVMGHWFGYLCGNLNRVPELNQELFDRVRARNLELRAAAKEAKRIEAAKPKKAVMDEADVAASGRPIIRLGKK